MEQMSYDEVLADKRKWIAGEIRRVRRSYAALGTDIAQTLRPCMRALMLSLDAAVKIGRHLDGGARAGTDFEGGALVPVMFITPTKALCVEFMSTLPLPTDLPPLTNETSNIYWTRMHKAIQDIETASALTFMYVLMGSDAYFATIAKCKELTANGRCGGIVVVCAVKGNKAQGFIDVIDLPPSLMPQIATHAVVGHA